MSARTSGANTMNVDFGLANNLLIPRGGRLSTMTLPCPGYFISGSLESGWNRLLVSGGEVFEGAG
jgi:hypothetical protein